MEENRHYILVDGIGRIMKGWSDGPNPERDTTQAVLLTESGGYQFSLEPGGEENPVLTNPDGTHRYIYDASLSPAYREATAEELAAEKAEIEAAREPPGPTDTQLIQQQITDLDLRDIEQGQALTDIELGGNHTWRTH